MDRQLRHRKPAQFVNTLGDNGDFCYATSDQPIGGALGCINPTTGTSAMTFQIALTDAAEIFR